MRRGIFIGALAAALAVAAGGDYWPPKRVASFPAPPGALDIALGDSYLLALVDGNPPTVYQLKYWSGSIVGSFTVRVPRGARGITCSRYPTRIIYISNRVNGYIYEIPMANSIVSSFVCRAGTPYGLTYSETCRHGTGLYAACRDENLIAIMDPANGLFLSSFAGPATAVTGFDYCFAVDRYTRFLYWDYYGAWEVIDTLPARLWGVAVGLYGKPYDEGIHGYVLCGDEYIYYYDGYIAVTPASLGRVKALFR